MTTSPVVLRGQRHPGEFDELVAVAWRDPQGQRRRRIDYRDTLVLDLRCAPNDAGDLDSFLDSVGFAFAEPRPPRPADPTDPACAAEVAAEDDWLDRRDDAFCDWAGTDDGLRAWFAEDGGQVVVFATLATLTPEQAAQMRPELDRRGFLADPDDLDGP